MTPWDRLRANASDGRDAESRGRLAVTRGARSITLSFFLGSREFRGQPNQVHHADSQPQERTKDCHPGSRAPPTVEAETEEGRERKLKADGRDSSAPVHPNRESRPAVGFLTHRRLRVFPRSPSNREESSRLAGQRPLTVAVASQENRGNEVTNRGGNLRMLGSFIQAQFRLSTTQQPASRNFSQSPQGRDARHLPLLGHPSAARLVLAHLPGESTQQVPHFQRADVGRLDPIDRIRTFVRCSRSHENLHPKRPGARPYRIGSNSRTGLSVFEHAR